jgi:hypothetical protein
MATNKYERIGMVSNIWKENMHIVIPVRYQKLKKRPAQINFILDFRSGICKNPHVLSLHKSLERQLSKEEI